MNLEEIQEILHQKLPQLDNRSLNETEQLILKGLWEHQTYQEMAQKDGYSNSYFANVVAPELYRRLSKLTGKHITKKNCQATLQSYFTESISVIDASSSQSLNNSSPHYPSGAVPLDSPYYLRQPSVENKILEEITQSGALVRIKAPQERGKTSLLLRILETCQHKLGYQTVSLNIQKADLSILEDFNKFLRWICVNCAKQLKLDPSLDDYWDEDMGIKMSWTIYFEEYLLKEIKYPLVLVFDEVNRVFEHPQVAADFFPLLRSCYEEGKRVPIWQKLRLIIVHSTEVYVSLHLEQSPFNVGLPIDLQGFSQEQVKQLAEKYQLSELTETEIQQLTELVGGHPALIHLAIYHLSVDKISFQDLIEAAVTATGIYAHHLKSHLITLQEQPDLANGFQWVCQSTEPVTLDPILAYQLNSMGLIHLVGNQVTISCQLYQKYFEEIAIT